MTYGLRPAGDGCDWWVALGTGTAFTPVWVGIRDAEIGMVETQTIPAALRIAPARRKTSIVVETVTRQLRRGRSLDRHTARPFDYRIPAPWAAWRARACRLTTADVASQHGVRWLAQDAARIPNGPPAAATAGR